MTAYAGWTRLVSNLIGAFAPAAAGRWAAQRAALSYYQSATKRGPFGLHRGSTSTADVMINRDLRDTVGRCRELVRDNTRIASAVGTIVAQVIYGGLRPQVQYKRVDGTRDTERNHQFEAAWSAWTEAVGWWDLEKLALRHCWQDGGLFLKFFPDPTLFDRGVVPLGVEPLEIDHLDRSNTTPLANGGRIVNGIEYDLYGHVVAYHLFRDHPGSNIFLGQIYQSERIPAEDVLYVWERDRASQHLGISWLAPLVMDALELDDYEASVRVVARLQATLSTFIKTQSHADYLGFAGFGGGGLDGTDDAGGVPAAQADATIPEFLETGAVRVLPPGLDTQTVTSTQPGPDYEAYTRSNLQGMSTGMGLSYETFSNDYAASSYASARNGSLNERRRYRMQQFFLVSHMHTPVWRRWCRMLRVSRLVPGAALDIPVRWSLPGWPWVDPSNDASAAKAKVELGTSSRQRIAAESGEDFFQVAEEQGEERKILAQQQAAPAPAQSQEGA